MMFMFFTYVVNVAKVHERLKVQRLFVVKAWQFIITTVCASVKVLIYFFRIGSFHAAIH